MIYLGVECLPIGDPNNLTSTAQLFDICTQLELAVQFLIDGDCTSEEALGFNRSYGISRTH